MPRPTSSRIYRWSPQRLESSEGEAAFWTSRQPTWGKLASVGKKPDKFAKEVKVSLRRLDSVVDELKLPPPALIKMDVEGSEIDVLEGARQDPGALPADSSD